MQSSKQLHKNLLQQITAYETQEAKEIVFWLMEFYLGLRKIDIISDKLFEKKIDWTNILKRLNAHEPIQYILGETIFYGRKFLVNNSVLIPRSETEELVKYIIDTTPKKTSDKFENLLDIGTGSGCIAISLAKELANLRVFACDISEKALEVAKKNATLNKADITFEKVDILKGWNSVTQFSIIVSNPPYVTKQETKQMEKHVLDFEPHLALFVENTRPLIFYEAIANFAFDKLADNGLLVVEINETLGAATAAVLIRKGFSEVNIIKDIHQKDRFISATLHKKGIGK